MEGFSIAIGITVFLICIILLFHTVSTKKKDIQWPPPSYMKELGGKCPDYWTYMGIDNNQVVCKNSYNVPINIQNKAQCITSKKTDTEMTDTESKVRFEKYSSWPPKGKALLERCKWIKECGERPGLEGSWIGIDKLCSEESYTSSES